MALTAPSGVKGASPAVVRGGGAEGAVTSRARLGCRPLVWIRSSLSAGPQRGLDACECTPIPDQGDKGRGDGHVRHHLMDMIALASDCMWAARLKDDPDILTL